MINPQKVFEQACDRRWVQNGRSIGPRLDPIPPEDAVVLKWCREIGLHLINKLRKETGLIEVYFDYVDSGSLNAVADVIGRQGYVGIFRGAPLLLSDLFIRMLSHPSVFSDPSAVPYLDASKELVNAQSQDGLATNIDKLRDDRMLAGRHGQPIYPISFERFKFAQMSTHAATSFLVNHELTHIEHGHCKYWRETVGTSFILEANSSLPTNDALLTRQAIETDADRTASSKSLFSLINVATHPENNVAAKIWSVTRGEPDLVLFCWCFGIAGLFILWGMGVDPHHLDTSLYPPPAVRFGVALHSAKEQIARQYFPQLYDKFDAIATLAYWAADHASRKVGGLSLIPIWDMNFQLQDPRTAPHIKKIENKLNEILPDLEKWSKLLLASNSHA